MCAWKGVSGDFRADGIPHQVKIVRQPEGVGAEFKSLADPHSGMLMHLEIQEGKDPMRAKEYCAEYGVGTACTLRMTKHWHGTGRTVCGDSWFGSLTCAKALSKKGLYCQFLVKTAHKHFPLNYLKRWAREQDQIVQADGTRVP